MLRIPSNECKDIIEKSGALNCLPIRARSYRFASLGQGENLFGGYQAREALKGKIVGLTEKHFVMRLGTASQFRVGRIEDFEFDKPLAVGKSVTIPAYDPLAILRKAVGQPTQSEQKGSGSFTISLQSIEDQARDLLKDHLLEQLGVTRDWSGGKITFLSRDGKPLGDLETSLTRCLMDMVAQLTTQEVMHWGNKTTGAAILLNSRIEDPQFSIDAKSATATLAFLSRTPEFKGFVAVQYNLATDDYTVKSQSLLGVKKAFENVYFNALPSTIAEITKPSAEKLQVVVDEKSKLKAVER